MLRVAVVTAREALGLDLDEPLLLQALAAAGVRADVCAWDDDGVDWGGYDVAVVRSTWDYSSRHEEFLAWAHRTAAQTRLLNPAPVMAWNTDKTYLRELAGRGVPVVPTTWVTHGEDVELPDGEVVVKPAVSAGSRDTARHAGDRREAALAHVRALTGAGRTVMVQPYIAAVDSEGETAMLFLGGRFSHAVTKAALLLPGALPTEALFAEEQIAPATETRRQREVADAVLAALPFDAADLTYARVDLVAGDDGEPLLLEVELTEPSLFLVEHPPAAQRLAEVITHSS